MSEALKFEEKTSNEKPQNEFLQGLGREILVGFERHRNETEEDMKHYESKRDADGFNQTLEGFIIPSSAGRNDPTVEDTRNLLNTTFQDARETNNKNRAVWEKSEDFLSLQKKEGAVRQMLELFVSNPEITKEQYGILMESLEKLGVAFPSVIDKQKKGREEVIKIINKGLEDVTELDSLKLNETRNDGNTEINWVWTVSFQSVQRMRELTEELQRFSRRTFEETNGKPGVAEEVSGRYQDRVKILIGKVTEFYYLRNGFRKTEASDI